MNIFKLTLVVITLTVSFDANAFFQAWTSHQCSGDYKIKTCFPFGAFFSTCLPAKNCPGNNFCVQFDNKGKKDAMCVSAKDYKEGQCVGKDKIYSTYTLNGQPKTILQYCGKGPEGQTTECIDAPDPIIANKKIGTCVVMMSSTCTDTDYKEEADKYENIKNWKTAGGAIPGSIKVGGQVNEDLIYKYKDIKNGVWKIEQKKIVGTDVCKTKGAPYLFEWSCDKDNVARKEIIKCPGNSPCAYNGLEGLSEAGYCNLPPDKDGDGIPDSKDNCLLVANENQVDVDLDGKGDECDNCVDVANGDQNDTNNDGVGDMCELGKTSPTCPIANKLYLSEIVATDKDGNGFFDSCEFPKIISTDADVMLGLSGHVFPAISYDGRYVTFLSYPGSGNAHRMIYDRLLDVTDCVFGCENNSLLFYLSSIDISANGRWISFVSDAKLVASDTDDLYNFYLYDHLKNEFVLFGPDPNPQNAFPEGTISANGEWVVFSNPATLPSKINLKNIITNQSIFVMNAEGQQPSSLSYNLSISADGKYVAFNSYAANLYPGNTNPKPSSFVFDSIKKEIKIVNINSDGEISSSGSSLTQISANGHFVAFSSSAKNLVPTDSNSDSDVFVHDMKTGETKIASVDSAGKQGSDSSPHYFITISSNGRWVLFDSWSNDLASSGENETYNLYVHDMLTGETKSVNLSFKGGPSKNIVWFDTVATMSADGRWIAITVADNNISDPAELRGMMLLTFNPLWSPPVP